MRGFTMVAPHVDRPDPPAKAIVADRRLYLAADEVTVVEYCDPNARFLLAPAGGRIAGRDVARLKLSIVDGRVVQQASTKQSAPEADKMAQLDGDKMLSPDGEKRAPFGKREKK